MENNIVFFNTKKQDEYNEIEEISQEVLYDVKVTELFSKIENNGCNTNDKLYKLEQYSNEQYHNSTNNNILEKFKPEEEKFVGISNILDKTTSLNSVYYNNYELPKLSELTLNKNIGVNIKSNLYKNNKLPSLEEILKHYQLENSA